MNMNEVEQVKEALLKIVSGEDRRAIAREVLFSNKESPL